MSIRVAIAQINPKLGDLRANMALYEEKIRQGSERKAELLLFPELSLTGYYLRDTVPSVALTIQSAEMKHLRQLSREMPFIAGLVEESADHRFFNSAVYFEDGEIRHIHRKVYLPTYGMFDEQRYFAAGDRVRALCGQGVAPAAALPALRKLEPEARVVAAQLEEAPLAHQVGLIERFDDLDAIVKLDGLELTHA